MSTLTLDYWQKYWNYFAPTYIASIEKKKANTVNRHGYNTKLIFFKNDSN